MNEGEKTVILVRAQTLSDALHTYLALTRYAIANRLILKERYVFAYLDRLGFDPEWEAERLRSSVERALGTRERHYDSKEEG